MPRRATNNHRPWCTVWGPDIEGRYSWEIEKPNGYRIHPPLNGGEERTYATPANALKALTRIARNFGLFEALAPSLTEIRRNLARAATRRR